MSGKGAVTVATGTHHCATRSHLSFRFAVVDITSAGRSAAHVPMCRVLTKGWRKNNRHKLCRTTVESSFSVGAVCISLITLSPPALKTAVSSVGMHTHARRSKQRGTRRLSSGGSWKCLICSHARLQCVQTRCQNGGRQVMLPKVWHMAASGALWLTVHYSTLWFSR